MRFLLCFGATLVTLNIVPSVSSLQNDTLNDIVPDDFVQSKVLAFDEGHFEVAGKLGKLDLVHKDHHRHLGTSDFPMGGFLIKWALIVFFVLTPLAFFPLLFLFVRGQPKEQKDDEADDDSNTPSGQQPLKNLKRAILLWPTIAHLDPYLQEPAATEKDGIVQVKGNTGEAYYLLDPSVSMQNSFTGQLYHPPSGMVFVPVHQYIFQPDAGLYVDILNGELVAPQPNHVYNRETNKLYERCLGLGYSMASSAFYIPRQPVIPEKLTTVVPVRRLLPEELTDSYRPKYIELLAKE
ncbi:hypothetical protein TYRP_019044 [Tyrophagus putrescentiae]|nr:hypothetical protein TYRP_019044 [Tyrophagus putrescentiae]